VRLFVSFAIFLALFAAACTSSQKQPTKAPTPTAPFSLVGTEWMLADLAGTPAIANSRASLAFPEAGRVAGNGSCNRFSGSVTITGDTLKFGPLASTRMACVDSGVSAQEDAYLKALGAANRYEYRDPDLRIYATGYDKPLRFTRATASAH
jgi:heat shock protein HslJ